MNQMGHKSNRKISGLPASFDINLLKVMCVLYIYINTNAHTQSGKSTTPEKVMHFIHSVNMHNITLEVSFNFLTQNFQYKYC